MEEIESILSMMEQAKPVDAELEKLVATLFQNLALFRL